MQKIKCTYCCDCYVDLSLSVFLWKIKYSFDLLIQFAFDIGFALISIFT